VTAVERIRVRNFPLPRVQHEGFLHWTWRVTDGLTGPTLIGPLPTFTSRGAHREATRACREVTGR